MLLELCVDLEECILDRGYTGLLQGYTQLTRSLGGMEDSWESDVTVLYCDTSLHPSQPTRCSRHGGIM